MTNQKVSTDTCSIDDERKGEWLRTLAGRTNDDTAAILGCLIVAPTLLEDINTLASLRC
jgi:hypothetical protein